MTLNIDEEIRAIESMFLTSEQIEGYIDMALHPKEGWLDNLAFSSACMASQIRMERFKKGFPLESFVTQRAATEAVKCLYMSQQDKERALAIIRERTISQANVAVAFARASSLLSILDEIEELDLDHNDYGELLRILYHTPPCEYADVLKSAKRKYVRN